MEPMLLFKYLHIVSATVLFGTGLGVAFFMVMAGRTREPKIVAAIAGMAVVANLIFTAVAGVVQPLTGVGLIITQERGPMEPWLTAAYGLFILMALCWVPLVFVQVRIKRLAEQAVLGNSELGGEYDRLYRTWRLLSVPVFVAMLIIFYLMLAQPALWSHPAA